MTLPSRSKMTLFLRHPQHFPDQDNAYGQDISQYSTFMSIRRKTYYTDMTDEVLMHLVPVIIRYTKRKLDLGNDNKVNSEQFCLKFGE
jgi:hypothetical protein